MSFGNYSLLRRGSFGLSGQDGGYLAKEILFPSLPPAVTATTRRWPAGGLGAPATSSCGWDRLCHGKETRRGSPRGQEIQQGSLIDNTRSSFPLTRRGNEQTTLFLI